MQDVQTLRRFGVPRTTARTVWMFGFQRRRVRTCECETLLPKPGPLPQMSQTEATVRSIDRLVESVGARACGDVTPAGTRQPAEHTRRHARHANPAPRVRTGMSAITSMLRSVTTLRDPLIRPLGRKTSDALESAFGLRTVGDLLRHYPRRYYTRGELTSLAALREGDHVTVLARVQHARVMPMRPPEWRQPKANRRPVERAEVIVTDGTATLSLMFF